MAIGGVTQSRYVEFRLHQVTRDLAVGARIEEFRSGGEWSGMAVKAR